MERKHAENKYIVLQKNTAKTKLLRESLFKRIGSDKTISFCYRQENELSDSQIISNLDKN